MLKKFVKLNDFKKQILSNEIEITKKEIILIIIKIILLFAITFYTTEQFPPSFMSVTTWSVIIVLPLVFFIVEFFRISNYFEKFKKIYFFNRLFSGIFTMLGIIIGAFFVILTIIWGREDPLYVLRSLTWIIFLLITFFILNGIDLGLIVMKNYPE